MFGRWQPLPGVTGTTCTDHQLREISANDLPWELLLLADASRAQIEKYIYQSNVLAVIAHSRCGL